MNRQTFPSLAALALAVLATGCAGGGPSVDTVRWEIERRIPEARFEPEEHIRLGRISMGFIHGILNLVHDSDADQARQIVNQIHRVEVATYKVKSLPDLGRLDGLEKETGFERDLARAGWTVAVRTREADERTWVFLQNGEDGGLNHIFVVSLEKGELTLVRVDGRLDRAFAAAVAEHPQKVAKQIGASD